MRIIWEVIANDWRETHARVNDYYLIVKGGKPFIFNWAVFYNNEEVMSSKNTDHAARSVIMAQKLAEVAFITHFTNK